MRKLLCQPGPIDRPLHWIQVRTTQKAFFCRAALILICLAGCAFLLPFLYALGFCFPRGDDFDEACRAMFIFDLPGGIYEIVREWLTWSGRYTYHFLAVFLGKAAHIRFMNGLVCGLVMALYFLSLYGLARLKNCTKGKAVFFAIFSLLAILGCWNSLTDFYLFTDALTICLQGAASLAFFYFLYNLWQNAKNNLSIKGAFRLALVSGVLAIGIYEHAALAVLVAIFLVWLASLYRKRKPETFARLGLWLGAALCFSFLAPGNFHRQSVRNASTEVERIFTDWVFGLENFVSGSWLVGGLCLGLILVCLIPKTQNRPTRKDILYHLISSTVVFILACLFSLAFAALHAQSDFTLQSHAKFISSLSLYLAFAVALIIVLLVSLLNTCVLNDVMRIVILLLAIICLTGKCVFTDNFRLSAMNAANGELLVYGNFMETRIEYLQNLGADAKKEGTPPKFGLAGEFFWPDSRKPGLDPALPKAIVCSFDENAFPVFRHEDLRHEPAVWPNKWAAWLYGLSGIICREPDPAAAFTSSQSGLELAIPKFLKENGLEEASILGATGRNPTFDITWLVLEFSGKIPEYIYVSRPNPVSEKRLLPFALQKSLLDNFLQKKECTTGLSEKLSATKLIFEARHWQKGNRLALPLVMARNEAGVWPKTIFLGLDGKKYYRLTPWLN